MKNKSYISVLLSLVCPTAAYCMTPQEAADAILGRNGDRFHIEVEHNAKDLETYTIANAPDPELEGEYMFSPETEDNRWKVGVSYGLEWPGVYKSRRNLGKALREANSAEAKNAIYQKYIEILKEIGNYVYADRRLVVMRNVAAFTDSLLIVTEKSHKGGQISRLDLSKIQLEQGRVKTAIANLEAEKNGFESSLKTLNGGMDCRALLASIDRTWVKTPTHSLEKYLTEARTSPELEMVMAEYRVANSNVKVAKSEGLPGLTVGYSHEYEEGMHFNGASLGISIPLFSNHGKVKAAEAAKAVAEYKVTVTTDKLESDISSLYEEIQLIDKELETPMQVFGETDYNTLLLKAYRGGQISLSEYLQERSWFDEAYLDLLELQYRREQKMWFLSILCKDSSHE